jgi:hypothetical protein
MKQGEEQDVQLALKQEFAMSIKVMTGKNDDRGHAVEEWAAYDSSILEQLQALYLEIEREAGRLELLHKDRLKCRLGCSQCCCDGISVFGVEAANIRKKAATVLQQEPNQRGGCAFLGKEGECRIYRHRPYVCRTQGLPLRWWEEGDRNEVVELRDICPLNESGPSLEELTPESMWLIGPFEGKLATLEATVSGSGKQRVLLRSLFFNDEKAEGE